jgi:hypothetical protein
MTRLSAFVTDWGVGLAESVTRTVKLNVPKAVGVPLIVPVPERVRPPGSGPDPDARVHVKVGVPPVEARDCKYELATVPDGSVAVVITRGAGAMTRVSAFVTDWGVGLPASVTRTVMLNVPKADGEPLMVPAAERVKPVGRGPDPTASAHV